MESLKPLSLSLMIRRNESTAFGSICGKILNGPLAFGLRICVLCTCFIYCEQMFPRMIGKMWLLFRRNTWLNTFLLVPVVNVISSITIVSTLHESNSCHGSVESFPAFIINITSWLKKHSYISYTYISSILLGTKTVYNKVLLIHTHMLTAHIAEKLLHAFITSA